MKQGGISLKKSRKKILSILLAAALLCVGLPQPAQAANFTDVPSGAWYRNYVYDLVDKGIIQGVTPTTFSPRSNLTRGAFTTMLAQTVLSEGDLRQYNYKSSFKDMAAGHWSTRFVNWAVEAGVVSGYEDKTFRPDRPVTREEMAVMVTNFARATGRPMSPVRGAAAFADNNSISKFAAASVRVCQRAGVIGGYEDNTFRPKNPATRAEAASLYSNFLNKCQNGHYTIIRKRVFNTPVRAVDFDPSAYTADLVMGRDMVDGSESPSSMVKRSGAVIAVNAAFFDMDSYLPIGTLIKEGRVITVSDFYAPAKSAFAMDSSGHFSIENFTTQHTITLHKEDGTDSVLKGVVVNRWPSRPTDAARILFTRDWGHNLAFTAKDAVTLAEDGTILSIAHDSDVPIPETGYVLAQRARREYEGDFFDSCKVGDVLDIERYYDGASTQDIELSIGAGPRIVKDRAPYGDSSTYRAEGFTDPNITSYDALRACIGIKADGRLVIVTAYTNLAQLSKIMRSFNCTDAINFDGGGSTNVYVDGQWLRGPQDRRLNNMLIFK